MKISRTRPNQAGKERRRHRAKALQRFQRICAPTEYEDGRQTQKILRNPGMIEISRYMPYLSGNGHLIALIVSTN